MIKRKFMAALFLILLFSGCELDYGKLGGADKTVTADTPEAIANIMGSKLGIWYSHYGGMRLDGYRIGRWEYIETNLGSKKLALFPEFYPDLSKAPEDYKWFYDSNSKPPQPNDYYVFYDDTVYGQGDDGSGEGNGGFGLVTRYIGLVRAVNTFHGTEDTGAVIIEYFNGAYPQWSQDVVKTPLPFFGVYFRVLGPDTIQIANAVELEALTKGEKYYTETRTLKEAIAKNNAENDGEFISWGVVIPQERE
ncbi:MAG: hypothetical protein LBK66_00535 [Spirochaetaceae bacterium]|jgi:hypothetical protein|nr:hypothetical protein [Spirochaetaceae bacterium]